MYAVSVISGNLVGQNVASQWIHYTRTQYIEQKHDPSALLLRWGVAMTSLRQSPRSFRDNRPSL
jgi:hypothetical protein